MEEETNNFDDFYTDEDENIFDEDDGVGLEEDNDDTNSDSEDDDVTQDDVDYQESNIEDNDNEETGEQEDTEPIEDNGANYSSIAQAIVDDGFISELSDDYDIDVSEIKNADDFYEFFDEIINAKLDAKQQRINEALNAEVPIDKIKGYENAISTLDTINKENLLQDNAQGERLRGNLLTQYYYEITKDPKKAQNLAKNSINSGNDKDDSLQALSELKDIYSKQYEDIISENKAQKENAIKDRRERAARMRDNIMSNDNELFNSFNINKQTRELIYDNISSPTVKVGNDYMTELQYYQQRNPQEFLMNVGMLFTITDGFRNFDNLGTRRTTREVNRRVKNLERVINNSRSYNNGNFGLMSGVSSEENSFGDGWKLSL